MNKIFSKEQEQWIWNRYKAGESTDDLAKIWGCNQGTIRNIVMRKGFSLRKLSIISSSPEAIQRSLKNGYGKKCYYNNEFFPSLLERDCYIKLRKLGFKVIHNFLNRFDFLLNKKIVVEFHPYDLKGLTNNQYYNQRRKLLNKYKYKNLKLVVIKDLKEIENKLR